MSAWGQRGWEEANAQGRDKVRQDIPDTQRLEGRPQGPPPLVASCVCEKVQLPTDALCRQGKPGASIAFKSSLIQHEKAISL